MQRIGIEKNLLEETVKILADHGHTLTDIEYVWTREGCFHPTEACQKFLNVTYVTEPYDLPKIREDLKLVGQDFWLERQVVPGQEWWVYQELPEFTHRPTRKLSPLAAEADGNARSGERRDRLGFYFD